MRSFFGSSLWGKLRSAVPRSTVHRSVSLMAAGTVTAGALAYLHRGEASAEAVKLSPNGEKSLSFLKQGVDIPPQPIDRTGCQLKEFIIPMPFTLGEYFAGAKRYSYARKCFEETKGKDGIEVVLEKPYIDPETGLPGIFSEKIYHLDGYFPYWLKAILPASALFLVEKSWDAYPFCVTKVTSPLFSRLVFIIETVHIDQDRGKRVNCFNLSPSDLAKCEVEKINLWTTPYHDKKHYRPEEDIQLLQQQRTLPRSLEGPNWIHTASPIMCCYKLVTIKFDYFGLQKLTEDYIMNSERDVIIQFHRQVFGWQQEWLNLSEEELQRVENQFHQQTKEKVEDFLKKHPKK